MRVGSRRVVAGCETCASLPRLRSRTIQLLTAREDGLMMMIKMTWLDGAAVLSSPLKGDDDKRTVWTNCVYIYYLSNIIVSGWTKRSREHLDAKRHLPKT